MVATTTRPAERERIIRFDAAERVLHWVNATLFLTVMATAAVLYVGPLSAAVGRRDLIRHIHVWCGIALPAPLLLTVIGKWGAAFRADVARLNRWTKDDRRWMRSLGRDPYVQLGKFNPGQKLNASFVAGVIVVMLGTGSIMNWFHYFPVDWRTGATFVHDWIAVILFFVVIGHIGMALADPESLGSMIRGWVPARWARDKRPGWYEEVQAGKDSAAARPSASMGSGSEK